MKDIRDIKDIGVPNVFGANEYACRSPSYLSAVNGFKSESITPPPLFDINSSDSHRCIYYII